jgi:hypothetical protein
MGPSRPVRGRRGRIPGLERHGRPILELRPRYNRIDESDKPERTEGFTYRAIAGWRSAPWNGLRFTLEAIHTGHIGPKEFNDDGAQFATSPYPLLPDPGHTGLNQANVEYSGPRGFACARGASACAWTTSAG